MDKISGTLVPKHQFQEFNIMESGLGKTYSMKCFGCI